MSKKHYCWKRFLVPRGGSISVDSLQLLRDPEDEMGALENAELTDLAGLDGNPVLVILGDPGIGKSTLLDDAERLAQSGGRHVERVDLSGFGSEDRLFRKLSSASVLLPDRRSDLLLDSLDTGLLAITTLADVLAEALSSYPTHQGLRLRIACRRGMDWPDSLEQALKAHWGEASVQVYELAPLRRRDVELAAQSEGLSPDAFIDLLRLHHAGPLASRPITLNFLLDMANAGQPFPEARAELYRRGCERLCDEPNRKRREQRRSGRWVRQERFAIAARIAAALILSNREAVWTGSPGDLDPALDCPVDDLVGEMTFPGSGTARLARQDIEEALDTGLFTLVGSDQRLGFAHQTYAEFLTAWYMHQQGLSTQRKLSLLCDPAENALVPQLYEVTAWSAALDETLGLQVLDMAPPVLLRSDVHSLAPALRAMLVSRLLEMADKAAWADTDWAVHSHYPGLAHPELAQQLRPWINDARRFIVARRIAIDIAEACRCNDLQDDLLRVAVNADETAAVRSQAIDALASLGDNAHRMPLQVLLNLPEAQDPAQSLKGAALEAIWPDAVDLATVLRHLAPPRNPDHFNSYRWFLTHSFTERLPAGQLPEALAWIRGRISSAGLDQVDHISLAMARAMVVNALARIDEPRVAVELAKTILALLNSGKGWLPQDIVRAGSNPVADSALRHKLVLAMLPLIQRPDREVFSLMRRPLLGPALIEQEDLTWLLDLALSSAYPTTTWTLGRMIARGYSPTQRPELANLILTACDTDSATSEIAGVLKRALAALVGPIALTSALARSARASIASQWTIDTDFTPSIPNPPPAVRVENALNQIESGEPESFLCLLQDLGWETDGGYDYREPLDIRELPGWQAATDATRTRIVDAAALYLQAGSPQYERLVETGEAPPSIRAARRALFLCDAAAAASGTKQAQPDWKRWAHAMLPRFSVSRDRDREWAQDALRRAYAAESVELQRVIGQLLHADLDNGHDARTVDGLDAIWDEHIGHMVREATEEAVSRGLPATFRSLFLELVSHAPGNAMLVAERLLRRASDPKATGEQELALIAADNLLAKQVVASWPSIFEAMEQNPSFGCELVFRVADGHNHHGVWLSWLPTTALGELTFWIEQSVFVDEGESASDFNLVVMRGKLIQELVERGTPEAVAALEAMSRAFPERHWLRWRLTHARESLVRAAWRAASQTEVLEVIRDERKQLVRSDEELLSVVVESLTRLQERLQRWNGVVRALWNEGDPAKPKEEDFLSDFVCDHLEQDLVQSGIIAQREVQVARPKRKGVGERTDIVVTASAKLLSGALETATVVIETKGCWNDKLNTEMGEQLKGRYLIDENHRCGIYLVGWYQPEAVDSGERRCGSSSNITIAEARLRLDRQAAELSDGGIRIRAFVLDARRATS